MVSNRIYDLQKVGQYHEFRDKTECIWIAAGQRWRSFSAPTVTVGGVSVSPSSGARNLGVYFDNPLSLKKHISNVSKSCYFQLRQMRVIRRSLPSDVLRTLLQAFVTCRLNYCNSLLVGLPAYDISRLQSVQNAAGRLFGGVSRCDSVDHVLRDNLHWLPVKQRIIFKVGVFEYKAIHGLAPPYLKELFVPVSIVPALSRDRSASCGDYSVPPATRNTTYRQHSFAVAGPTWWNYFPLKIRNSSSMQTFHSRLKTFLFREAYNIFAS